jgi:hypothetical protein
MIRRKREKHEMRGERNCPGCYEIYQNTLDEDLISSES